MRILYVGQTRFPTEKAHGHQIAQVCSGDPTGTYEAQADPLFGGVHWLNSWDRAGGTRLGTDHQSA